MFPAEASQVTTQAPFASHGLVLQVADHASHGSHGSHGKVFKSMFDRRSIDFKFTSDTCSILRPATTRDGSLRPETTRYDRRRFVCGSHGSVSQVTVRMVSRAMVRIVLTVRCHKSRFAWFSRFGFTSHGSHCSHGSVSQVAIRMVLTARFHGSVICSFCVF